MEVGRLARFLLACDNTSVLALEIYFLISKIGSVDSDKFAVFSSSDILPHSLFLTSDRLETGQDDFSVSSLAQLILSHTCLAFSF